MDIKRPAPLDDPTLRRVPGPLSTPGIEKRPESEVVPECPTPLGPLAPLAELPTERDRTEAVGQTLEARAVTNRLRFGGLEAHDLLDPLVCIVQSNCSPETVEALTRRLERAFPSADDLTQKDAAALCRARDLICELTDAADRRSPRMDRLRAFFNERHIRFHRTDELPEGSAGFEVSLGAFRRQLEDWRDGPNGKAGPVVITRHRARALATTISNLADDRQVLAVKSMLARAIDPSAKSTSYDVVFADRTPALEKAAKTVLVDALGGLSSAREPMAEILVAARRGTPEELLAALQANAKDKETLAFARRYLARPVMRRKLETARTASGQKLTEAVDAFMRERLPAGTWTRYDTKVDLERQFYAGKISRKQLRIGKAAALTSGSAEEYKQALRFAASLSVQVFFADLQAQQAEEEKKRDEEDHRKRVDERRLDLATREQRHGLERQHLQRVEAQRVETRRATTQPSMRLARGQKAELLAVKQELFHRIDQATTIEELMSLLGKLNAREGEASAVKHAAAQTL